MRLLGKRYMAATPISGSLWFLNSVNPLCDHFFFLQSHSVHAPQLDPAQTGTSGCNKCDQTSGKGALSFGVKWS